MKIYTRTGDKGTTSLVGGTRTPKDDLRIEAYGTVDELMAHTGYLHDMLDDRHDMQKGQIKEVLDRLMSCASLLAAEDATAAKLPQVFPEDVERLEEYIDVLQQGLPELRHFTLPCGNPQLSYCHVCRTVCRRAERRVVSAAGRYPAVPDAVRGYLNRLSDYFYALGRRLGYDLGAEDVRWEPKK
ncbi:cob(I)yrinic acid a,c-diamide adenosyltransferase [uncultured Rikenella sp.]|uniref:cob(I)yrinic acid a,c-diamide adenosyltransferase n=1 Tax=uncultured Rikenella sp. TaxID=368003 RepID=UPI0026056E9A|nr:cob(I)yrinic acid a,c-diamide adenosyltransferase [uncultured Rikenella sp.]